MSRYSLTTLKNIVDSWPFKISSRFIRPLVRFLRFIFRFSVNLIYAPLAGIFWLSKLKFPDFFIGRIGHLMCEPDCFLKEQLLKTGRIPRAIMLAPKGKSANEAVVKYWSNYFIVINNQILINLLKPLQNHPWTEFKTYRYVTAMNQTADIYKINAHWNIRQPLLKLKPSDVERGNELLNIIGIPKGAWYVCIHAREGKYSPNDEHLHSFRNVSIADFEKSVAFIVSQGGFCIRMGDSTMTPAPKIPGLIDYALSIHKQDWMDIFLAATCKFFLGSNSGAYAMSTIFGIPSAIVNLAPPTVMPFGIKDLGIPMIYQSKDTNQIISFNQIMKSPAANYRSTDEFIKARIILIKNTPEEILALTIEMLQKIQGNYIFDEYDELRQEKLISMLKFGHYCFGSASRVGSTYLKKYQNLL